VRQLPLDQDFGEKEFDQRLKEQIPHLGESTRGRIMEAGLWLPITPRPGTCVCWCATMPNSSSWWRTNWPYRHYQSLEPCVPQHRELLEAFRKRYWDFYKELRSFRLDGPSCDVSSFLSVKNSYGVLRVHADEQSRPALFERHPLAGVATDLDLAHLLIASCVRDLHPIGARRHMRTTFQPPESADGR
jgi:hypothetical protein